MSELLAVNGMVSGSHSGIPPLVAYHWQYVLTQFHDETLQGLPTKLGAGSIETSSTLLHQMTVY
jgi:hypothetical protein